MPPGIPTWIDRDKTALVQHEERSVLSGMHPQEAQVFEVISQKHVDLAYPLRGEVDYIEAFRESCRD